MSKIIYKECNNTYYLGINKGYFKEKEPRLDIVAFFNDMSLAIMFDGIERNGMATLL